MKKLTSFFRLHNIHQLTVFYFKNINQISTLKEKHVGTYVISTYYVLVVVTGLKRIQRKKSLHILKEGIIVPLTIHASNYGLYNYSM